MKSTTIRGEIKINAGKEQVWDALANFGDIYQASPGVVKSYLTSDAKTGVGATRHCDFTANGADGGNVEEEITAWEEGESMSINITEFNKIPGIKHLLAEFDIRADGKDTILRAVFTYSMKNILFDAMNPLMVKKANTKALHGLLAGYKKNIESGEEVQSATKIAYDKVVTI